MCRTTNQTTSHTGERYENNQYSTSINSDECCCCRGSARPGIRKRRDEDEAFQVQMIDLKANIQKARLEVRKLVNQDTVNREAVMKAVEAESAASLALRKAVVEQQIKAREIIGPEKAAQLREMRQERGYGDGGRRDDDSNDRDGDSGDRGRGEGPGGDW
jgi:hypothetical protein